MSQERLTKRETRPQFKIIATVDKTGRVGIIEDDSWVVGWQQPNGELVWHKHADIWRVFRQNLRVIQSFLGVPIDEREAEESKSDPNLGVSLPRLKDQLIIFGETQKAQELAKRIDTIVSLAVGQRTPMSEILPQIERLRDQLSPKVRNEFKVRARQKLAEAAQTKNIAQFQTRALEAFAALLERAHEGASIVGSLIARASSILEWVDTQELQIETLKHAVGAALVEIKIAEGERRPVSQNSLEIWKFRFLGSANVVDKVLAIKGSPYAAIVRRSEIVNLRNIEESLEGADIALLQRRFEAAYPIIQKVKMDRGDREASGFYNRYRLSKGYRRS